MEKSPLQALQMKRVFLSAFLLGLLSTPPAVLAQSDFSQNQVLGGQGSEEESPTEYYSNYAEQAMQHYRKGESTKAIELMSKAYQLAPNNTAILNNLAASYIQRGVYYQNKAKDYPKAISDYRNALFLLEFDWPESVQRTQAGQANVEILDDNLTNAMKSANIPIADSKWHLQSAWELRRKGLLPEAMVEYAWATKLNPKNSEAWAAQGDIYTVRQKHQKAIDAYQKAIDSASAPSDALYIKLGTAQLQTENPQKAVDAFNKALAINPKSKDALLALEQVWKKEIVLDPRNMSAHLNLGAVYQQMNRFEEAHAQYQVAERLSPNNPLIKMNLSSLYLAQGNKQQASQMVDAILQQNPNNAQALLYKADILKQQGRPQEAEQFLQKALQSSPNKKQILDQLIGIYKGEGNALKLKSGWDMYTRQFPQDADVHYQAALSMHEMKDYDSAIAYYQKAIQLKPGMAEAHANLGTALHAVNRDQEALAALKKALSLNPQLDQAKDLIGALETRQGSKIMVEATQLHEQGKYAEAARKYEEALKRETSNATLYANYGLTLQALKRYKEAVTAYDKALALEPENATYYYYKGTAYDQQSQWDAARKQFEMALAKDSNLTQAQEALNMLANATTQTGLAKALEAYEKQQYPQALQQVDAVLKADPDNAMAYYYQGLVFDAQKKLPQAKTAYEKALSLDSGMTDAVYALAVVLDTQGNKAEAKKQYQQFINMTQGQPEDDFVRYAKERISTL